MFELLARHGVEQAQARDLAINTLDGLDIDVVAKVLLSIKRPSPEYRYFQTGERLVSDDGTRYKEEGNVFRKWWPSLYMSNPTWVSPPRGLVVRSAKGEGVLCVNVKGEWSLRNDGYVALSHVWIEGLQRVEEHGGFETSKLLKVFELLKRANIQSEWMWTDVLVIPGGGKPTASLEDELLTVDLINSMPTVYSKAEAVLVIDAHVLQLHSTNVLDVAIALACGKWATRVWTFQEIKLASRAVIVTATGSIEFADMTQALKTLEELDSARYRKLYLWAAIMGKSDTNRLSLRDLVFACSHRRSGYNLDYARAFFPVLGLTWVNGMTREQGMQKIYYTYPEDAMVLAPYAGSSRLLLDPAWAPSYFGRLEGVGHGGLQWRDRGIYGEWYVLKINSLVSATRPIHGRIGLNVCVGSDNSQIQCTSFANEPSSVVEATKKMIADGKGWIISVDSFAIATTTFARSVLLVEEAKTKPEHGMEVAVHCATSCTAFVALNDDKKALLIRHGNPNVDMDLYNLLKYQWFREEETSQLENLPQQEGETAC